MQPGTIPVAEIASNPYQPRKSFKPEELVELQDSLRLNGLLQAITVRPSPKGKGYELIAGERRLRAAISLGWSEIPAVVKKMNDQELLTMALVENLQRADLNPVEEAEGYEQLIKQFGYTQQTVAELVGKDRSTVANILRMLQLPTSVRALVQEGRLSAGQARPLLALEDGARITAFAKQAVENGWSARDVERRVRDSIGGDGSSTKGRPPKLDHRPPEVRALEQRLRKHLQTDVSINLKSPRKGSIVIDFYSADDLDRLIDLLGLSVNPQ
ncbi:MAG TPA: ParB/RepB/Spo0J family partition protein [Gemmatimonadaceae bacterium]|nr:ParB/RepB/Spo0J family partition protein [Gemmatimonadaceae bacterium]